MVLALDRLFKTHYDMMVTQLPSSVAVAVSGGADSMALVLLAQRLFHSTGTQLVALTVDHGLRPEAASEAQQVSQWLATHKIEHHILTGSGDVFRSNIQHQARTLRYELLGSYCREQTIEQLWLGHHLQDQAETVLLRLIRGSGVDGLSAMAPIQLKKGLMYVRPLLALTKEQLMAYLKERGQNWIEDPSNNDDKYDRVTIRKLLQTVPDAALLISRLAQTAAHMRRTRDYLDIELQKHMDQVIHYQDSETVQLDMVLWRRLHEEMALRLLSNVLMQVSGQDYRPRFKELERLYEHLNRAYFSGATLHGCRLSVIDKGKIIQISKEK